MLKETLEQALINLSKSDVVHFKEVQEQITDIKAALFVLEGTDVVKLFSTARLLKEHTLLSKQVAQLEKQKKSLALSVSELQKQLETLKAKKK